MATTDDSAGPGLYDLAPLHDRLPEVIDFDLLNAAAPEGRAPRLTVVATDIASGERVVFDTRRRGRAGGGGPIGPEHLIASCALMPDFAPVAVGDRLLGDGGFTANAPLDLVLDEPAPPDDPRPLLCFLLELFPQRGERPRTLAGAAARASDLVFGGQTGLILEGRRREHRLRAMVAALAPRLPPELRRDPEVAALLAEGRAAEAAPLVLSLTYHPPAGEADLQRTFDFSRTALAGRWAAGAEHMGAALRALRALPGLSEAEGAAAAGRPGLRVHEVGRPGPPAAPGGSAGGPDSPGQAAAAGVGARGAA
jgi:NTE family protein